MPKEIAPGRQGLPPEMEIDTLRRLLGDKIYPIASERFLGKSKERYGRPPWLTREIAQNFLDHNPGARRGTLDGVNITAETIGRGITRFTIKGSWPFPDPTALVTLHSDKPQDVQTAGGNAIGIKQAALIMFRDKGVKIFEVTGERWKVNYKLVPKSAELKHDWLVAELEGSENQGTCSYIIETDNPALTEAMNEMPHIAVCEDNRYLKNPDFKNEKGVMKWLPPSNIGAEPGNGRLFINGQVMDVDKGPVEGGWQGIQGVTLQLNDVNYAMSIDRPPMNHWEVGMHANELIRTMELRDLVEQVSNSEKIWAGADEKKYQDALEIVEKIVRALSWKFKFSDDNNEKKIAQDLQAYFIERKYLARTQRISEKQEAELKAAGYVLCPKFFTDLNMPSVADQIENPALNEGNRPDAFGARRARERAAEESGVEVGYEDFSNLSPEQFQALIKERLEPITKSVVVNGKDMMRVGLSIQPFENNILLKPALNGSSDPSRLLNTIRGVAAYGLARKIFSHLSLSQEDGTLIFGIDKSAGVKEPTLLVRKVTVQGTKDNMFIDIGMDKKIISVFEKLLTSQTRSKKEKITPTSSVSESSSSEEIIERREFSSPWGKRIAVASIATLMAGAGWWAVGNKSRSSSEVGSNIPPISAGAGGTGPGDIGPTTPGTDNKVSGSAGSVDLGAGGQKRSKSLTNEKFFEWLKERRKNNPEVKRYPSKTSLQEIIEKHRQANVPIENNVNEKAGPEVVDPFSDEIEDFNIIENPSEKEVARLQILRDAFYVATGIDNNDPLFIYTGRGARGVNFGGEGIGVHREVIKGNFLEALGTFFHEQAHEVGKGEGHGPAFQAALTTLFLETQRKLIFVLAKYHAGDQLAQEDLMLVSLASEWEKVKP